MSSIPLCLPFEPLRFDKLVYAPQAAGPSYLIRLDARIGWPNGVETPEDYCQRTFSMSVRRFMAIAAAPGIARHDVDVLGLDQVPFNVQQHYAQSRVTVEEATQVIDALTYSPPNTDPNSLISDRATFWCFFDFAAQPFVPAGEGLVVPCSFRHSFERATSGIFWMMHAAQHGSVERLTTHFGHLFEDYCLRITEPLASESLTVSGEIEYGPAGSQKKGADILLTTSQGRFSARVFVECRAGRPPRSVFAEGDVVAFRRYLDDLVEKLKQSGSRHERPHGGDLHDPR